MVGCPNRTRVAQAVRVSLYAVLLLTVPITPAVVHNRSRDTPFVLRETGMRERLSR